MASSLPIWGNFVLQSVSEAKTKGVTNDLFPVGVALGERDGDGDGVGVGGSGEAAVGVGAVHREERLLQGRLRVPVELGSDSVARTLQFRPRCCETAIQTNEYLSF